VCDPRGCALEAYSRLGLGLGLRLGLGLGWLVTGIGASPFTVVASLKPHSNDPPSPTRQHRNSARLRVHQGNPDPQSPEPHRVNTPSRRRGRRRSPATCSGASAEVHSLVRCLHRYEYIAIYISGNTISSLHSILIPFLALFLVGSFDTTRLATLV
jgi:hypothetical protein